MKSSGDCADFNFCSTLCVPKCGVDNEKCVGEKRAYRNCGFNEISCLYFLSSFIDFPVSAPLMVEPLVMLLGS